MQPDPKESGTRGARKRIYGALRYTHVGISFLLLVLLPTMAGSWLDDRTQAGGLWTLAGAAIGFALGVTFLVYEIRKVE